MITELLKKISYTFAPREEETFLVIEECDGGLEVTEAAVDHTEKRMQVSSRGAAGSFRELRRPRSAPDRIVLALAAGHATTVEGTVRVRRQNAERLVDESELDALVFKGLWEFLNRHRSWISKKMSVSDLDLVLAHIEIKDVKLGTHRLLNPLGFKGNDFLITFRGTFIPRALTPLLERFRVWGGEVVTLERGTTLASLLGNPDDFSAIADERTTSLFSSLEGERLYLRELPWGVSSIREAIATQFGVSTAAAGRMLHRAARGGVSERLSNVMGRTIREQLSKLGDFIRNVTHRSGDGARVATHIHIRSLIPHLSFIDSTPRFRTARFNEVLEEQGFSVHAERDAHGFTPSVHQEVLALLAYPYAHPHYAFLNQLLRRRAKWLIPHPAERL